MALTADELGAIRGQIGATIPPSDEDLESAFTRLGNTKDVVLEVLRSRMADYLARPASVTIPGIYHETQGNAAALLADQINDVALGNDGRITTSRLRRAGRSRNETPPGTTPL